MPTRFDYAPINQNARRSDEGYLFDEPIVARTGILSYRRVDGTVRKELRLPEDVFHTDSLASYIGKPITVAHPKIGKVDKKSVKSLTVGTMLGAGRQDGENVRVPLVIHTPDEMGNARQLSVGYDVDIEETPGVWNGERYDAIQRNIRVNHLSIVAVARAGAEARLNLDSDELPLTTTEEKPKMPQVRLDSGIEYEAPAEVCAAIAKMRADAETNAGKLNEAQTLLSGLQGKVDTLQARVDGIPAEIETAKKAGETAAAAAAVERGSLEKTAALFKVDCADKTADQIKLAVIKVANPKFNADGKDAAYINGAFDSAVEMRADANMQQQRRAVTPPAGKAAQTNNDSGEVATGTRSAYLDSIGHRANA